MSMRIIPSGNPFGSSIDTAEISDSAVTTAKIADGAVTSAKLSSIAGWDVIASGTLGSDTGTLTISSIPTTYKRLKLYVEGRTTLGGTSDPCELWFNSDTGNNYVGRNSANGAPSTTAKQTYLDFGLSGDNGDASCFSILSLEISNQASQLHNVTGDNITGILSSTPVLNEQSVNGIWLSTAKITAINLKSHNGGVNLKTGTTYLLLGLTQ